MVGATDRVLGLADFIAESQRHASGGNCSGGPEEHQNFTRFSHCLDAAKTKTRFNFTAGATAKPGTTTICRNSLLRPYSFGLYRNRVVPFL